MLFALYDYFHYRRRSGRYRRDINRDPMAAAWEGGIPDDILGLLSDGDILFFQTFDSVTSWGIMYGTSSLVSHVGFYFSGHRIGHAMPKKGVVLESISQYFKPNIRILPTTIPNKPASISPESFTARYEDIGYGYSIVTRKAINILLGRHWYYFRWKFFVDAAVALAFMDAPLLILLGYPILSWLVPLHFAVIIFNAVLWRIRPLSAYESGPLDGGAPVDAFRFVQAYDGGILGSAHAIGDQLPEGTAIFRKQESDSSH
jgi:hypothetical protein